MCLIFSYCFAWNTSSGVYFYLEQARFFIQFHDLKNVVHLSVDVDNATVKQKRFLINNKRKLNWLICTPS